MDRGLLESSSISVQSGPHEGQNGQGSGLLAVALAELIGTLVLVLTITMGSEPLYIGLALAVMIFAAADVSGGQFNPAVTVAILIREALEGSRGRQSDAPMGVKGAVVRLVGQFAGAFVGAFLGHAILVDGNAVRTNIVCYCA
jgi:glycerol uptake facilitator-like aquaporin